MYAWMFNHSTIRPTKGPRNNITRTTTITMPQQDVALEGSPKGEVVGLLRMVEGVAIFSPVKSRLRDKRGLTNLLLSTAERIIVAHPSHMDKHTLKPLQHTVTIMLTPTHSSVVLRLPTTIMLPLVKPNSPGMVVNRGATRSIFVFNTLSN